MSPENIISESPGAATPSSALNIPQKGVTIFDEPEHIPNDLDDQSSAPTSHSPRSYRANISGKKLTGRPAMPTLPSTTSVSKDMSSLNLTDGERSDNKTPIPTDIASLLTQVTEWLQQEKVKRHHVHGLHGHHGHHFHHRSSEKVPQIDGPTVPPAEDQDLALDKLERILAGFALHAPDQLPKPVRKHSLSMLKNSSIARKMRRGSTAHGGVSDAEMADAVAEVPHVESTLDNTKTLAYIGGESEPENKDVAKQKDEENWAKFKQEIVRLTHTLKVRGWRRIPIEQGSLIHVERLSGAMTNAVYVVKPPKEMPDEGKEDDAEPKQPKRKPLELLLRIYGPQVEHLVDRENELSVLRRLAAKNIGPRLLGYFTNGRFEEYLHATTLKAIDLRDPVTSKQIAKRMRELHDGIDLLESERNGGPFAFLNWNKWVERSEKVATFLDTQVKNESKGIKPRSERYTKYGLICGAEWPVFRAAVERYRERLTKESGGESGICKKLVFAHNDTQYGNLMRIAPPNESPLMQPTNQHKQLVVIDFEYASANTVGYEFADHFIEWCYNYHEPQMDTVCQTHRYPTPEEQYRFVRAYVMHRPQFGGSASSTPKMEARDKTNISDFMLDARAPSGASSIDYDAEEKAREQATENQIQALMHQTRLWRVACSAQWAAWGLVQAKIPELENTSKKSVAASLVDRVKRHIHPKSDPLDPDVKDHQEAAKHDRPEGREKEEAHAEGDVDEVEEEEEEGGEIYNYLAYAHDRVMLFWGDCIQMGIVKEEDLPESTRKEIKYVKY